MRAGALAVITVALYAGLFLIEGSIVRAVKRVDRDWETTIGNISIDIEEALDQ